MPLLLPDVEAFVGSNNLEIAGGEDRRKRRREQYSAMPEVQKSILLSRKREYYERRKVVRDCTGGTTEDPDSIVGNDQTDDAYGIFEPDVHQPNFDGTYINFPSLIMFCIYFWNLSLTLLCTRLLGHGATK